MMVMVVVGMFVWFWPFLKNVMNTMSSFSLEKNSFYDQPGL